MKIGSLVECVKSQRGCAPNWVEIPVIGSIYTVRAFKEFKGRVGILVEEIINKPFDFNTGSEEPYFLIDWFRELLPPIENIEELINHQTIEIELV